MRGSGRQARGGPKLVAWCKPSIQGSTANGQHRLLLHHLTSPLTKVGRSDSNPPPLAPRNPKPHLSVTQGLKCSIASIRHQYMRCSKLTYGSLAGGECDAMIAHASRLGQTYLTKQSMKSGNLSACGVKATQAVVAVPLALAIGNPSKT